MSTTTNNLPPTLPLGTPSTEWAKDTQNLLEGKTDELTTTERQAPATQVTQVPATLVTQAPATQATQAPATLVTEVPATQITQVPATQVTQPPLSRGESKDTILDIPGGWGKPDADFPTTGGDLSRDTEKAYATVSNVFSSAAQAVQAGLANLTSPADTSTNRPDFKASGPVGAPAHPSSATAGLGETIQGGLNSLVETTKNAVSSVTGPADKRTGTEEPAHVVGLLPPPPASGSKSEGEASSSELQLKSGGAMINTTPPTDLHPAQSDQNTDVAPLSHTSPSGPSPVDGIPAGETRANLDTAHTGNYAYTNLPTKEGNVTDPHAGQPGTGYIDQAKTVVSNVAADPMGSLTGALAAVGLGGAAATAMSHEQLKDEELKDKPAKEVEPVEEIDTGTTGKAVKSPAKEEGNFLAPEGVTGSPFPVDEDVQAALGKGEGKVDTEKRGPTIDGVNSAAKKEHDLTAELGGRPTGPVHTSSNPIQTTTNTYDSKASVATSPATAVGESGSPDHSEAAGKTRVTDSVKDTIKSATKEMKPTTKKDEDKPAITTTSNTQDKAAPATSPATAVEAKTSPAADKATSSATPAAAPKAAPMIDTTTDGHTRETTENTTTTTTSGSTTSSPTKSHKRGPSLKDRIKGEMKVITGKLSRNEAKVEEGRALKSGGLSATSAVDSPVSPARK